MADFIENTITAIQDIRSAPTPGTYIKQRLAVNAENLSNAARIESAIAIANEALCKATEMLYETVERVPVNVDSRTYRILIPLPWGDSGYHKWGMHAVEARVLRSVLMTRYKNEGGKSLFDFDGRKWFLNVDGYKNQALAMAYWREKPITAREWMRHVNAWKESEVNRYQRRKEKKSTRR